MLYRRMAGMAGLLTKRKINYEEETPFLFDEVFIKNVRQTQNNLLTSALQIVKVLKETGANVPEVTDRDTLLTTREVARLFGVSARTIERYRAENRIPSIAISERVYRFRKADMFEYLNVNYNKAKDYID